MRFLANPPASASATTAPRPGVSQSGSMNRELELVRAPAVVLRRCDHPPGVAHRDPERERATSHGVHFVESGQFRVRTTGAWRDLTTATLLVTTPELELSFAHGEAHPTDTCLSVSFSDAAIESARAHGVLDATPVRQLTNRLAFLRRALAESPTTEAARVEALGGELLAALSAGAPRQPLFRADRLAWYAARVDRAKQLMAARYAEPLSLTLLARDAGVSVFHFARVFAELEGRAPHRYLTELRLTEAHARLRGGAAVTDTCFAVGFGSLSHFVTTFRRRFGVRPSALRRGATSGR